MGVGATEELLFSLQWRDSSWLVTTVTLLPPLYPS